jgi:hypothetical protein
MSDDELELSIMSDEELEASLHPEQEVKEVEKPTIYKGPNRRSGKDRRVGPKCRRNAIRFDPKNAEADRRSGKDRRIVNNKREDLWDHRDE